MPAMICVARMEQAGVVTGPRLMGKHVAESGVVARLTSNYDSCHRG